MATVDNQTTAPPVGNVKAEETPKFNFPVSEVPKNPLGEGKFIKTAAALIIGYVVVGNRFTLIHGLRLRNGDIRGVC